MKTSIYDIEKKLNLLNAKIMQETCELNEIDDIFGELFVMIQQEKKLHQRMLKHFANDEIYLLMNNKWLDSARYKKFSEEKAMFIDSLT